MILGKFTRKKVIPIIPPKLPIKLVNIVNPFERGLDFTDEFFTNFQSQSIVPSASVFNPNTIVGSFDDTYFKSDCFSVNIPDVGLIGTAIGSFETFPKNNFVFKKGSNYLVELDFSTECNDFIFSEKYIRISLYSMAVTSAYVWNNHFDRIEFESFTNTLQGNFPYYQINAKSVSGVDVDSKTNDVLLSPKVVKIDPKKSYRLSYQFNYVSTDNDYNVFNLTLRLNGLPMFQSKSVRIKSGLTYGMSFENYVVPVTGFGNIGFKFNLEKYIVTESYQ